LALLAAMAPWRSQSAPASNDGESGAGARRPFAFPRSATGWSFQNRRSGVIARGTLIVGMGHSQYPAPGSPVLVPRRRGNPVAPSCRRTTEGDPHPTDTGARRPSTGTASAGATLCFSRVERTWNFLLVSRSRSAYLAVQLGDRCAVPRFYRARKEDYGRIP
jgi:hypothetical protein